MFNPLHLSLFMCIKETPSTQRCSQRSSSAGVEEERKVGQWTGFMYVLNMRNTQGIQPDPNTYAGLLQICIKRNALTEGRRVHADIIRKGFGKDRFLQNHIVNMYAKCGNIADAGQVFDKIPERNLVSWSAMVAGYAQNGCGEESVKLFREMQREGFQPNEFTYASVGRACAGMGILEEGDEIHAQAIKAGYDLNVFVGSALVDMYAKCGAMEEARKVFDRMPERNVVSWTGMIAGYLQDRNEMEVLNLFWQMQQAGTEPNQFTSSCVLSGCANLEALEQGKQVHASVIKSGLDMDNCVGNALIDMYAKCRRLEDACKVFEIMPEQDAISWNAMISGYSQNNRGENAMKLFRNMQWAGVKQDEVRFSAVLGACASLAALSHLWMCPPWACEEGHSSFWENARSRCEAKPCYFYICNICM